MPNQEPMIKVQDVRFRYDPEQPKYAVDGVSLDIRRGEFVAVLGANGCGKSTLAKHFNAILLPEAGTVLVEGMDTRNEDLPQPFAPSTATNSPRRMSRLTPSTAYLGCSGS
jgi:energy-coupling factor transport system ATP-binding protein